MKIINEIEKYLNLNRMKVFLFLIVYGLIYS